MPSLTWPQFGSAPAIVRACHLAGVSRAVFVSSTAIFTTLNASSKLIRKSAESCIFNSGLEATALRPTMIYGTPGDRNIIRLIHWIYRWPVLPIFGNGLFLQQPVYVSDVAWSIVQALESPATINRQFNISGAEPLSYNKLVSTTAKALSRRIRCLHIPAQPVVRMLDI